MPLSESLRSAWAPQGGCPAPEEYLRLESGELSPEEARKLEEHAAGCPACSAERDLARLFATSLEEPEEIPVRQEDVDFVVARLEGLKLHETARPLAFPARRRPAFTRRGAWAGSLAALVALTLALGLFLRAGQAPPLPDPGSGTVVRGGELRLASPIGEFREMPREFRWVDVDTARSYRVTLRAVDDTVLWQETVAAPPARLPEEVLRGLHPAVLYTWSVEALDGRGERLAVSEPARFRVRPPGEGGSTP